MHLDSVWIGNDMPMNQVLKFRWSDPDRAALRNLCLQGFSNKRMIWDAALLYPPDNSVADLVIDRNTRAMHCHFQLSLRGGAYVLTPLILLGLRQLPFGGRR